MQYGTLGRTGILVSRMGIGGSAFGGGLFHRDDRATLALLAESFDRGVNYLDTSDNYSVGRSEALIGRAVRGRRADIVIATKGGAQFTPAGRLALAARPLLRPVRPLLAPMRRWLNLKRDSQKRYVYRASHLRQALEASLRRLGTDYVDIYQLYNPVPGAAGLMEAFEFLERIRLAGKARCVGISVNRVDDAIGLLEQWVPDTIQFPMSLLDQRARRGFLREAAGRGIGLIARSALAQGMLTDAVGHLMADESSHLGAATLVEWRAKREMLRCLVRPDRTLAQAALRFVLQQPEVSLVLVGVVGAAELRENLGAEAAPALDGSDIARVEEISSRI